MAQSFPDRIKSVLHDKGIIPIINPRSVELTLQIAEVLMGIDLPVLEITFRSPQAANILTAVRKRFPGMILGAGTLRNPTCVRDAKRAGADFGLSPAWRPEVIRYAENEGLPFIPGVDSPSLVEEALENGYGLLKAFPADLLGGPRFLKAIGGPYPEARFLPTGGIDDDNLESYLACKNVLALGGTWFLSVASKEFVDIAKVMAVFDRVQALRHPDRHA